MTLEKLTGKKVLMVYSHCDDEIVCGWPVFQDPSIEKYVLIVSSDRNNDARQWCNHRRWVFLDLCKSLGIGAKVLDYSSDFYALSHRTGNLAKFENDVLRSISSLPADFIMTHNPFGEYGHLDHRFLSDLLRRSLNSPIIITDIEYNSDWTDIYPKSDRYRRQYFYDCLGRVQLDHRFYRYVEHYYKSRNAWTWSQGPQGIAGVYKL